MILLDCIKVQRFLTKLDANKKLAGKKILFVTVRNYSFVLHQELFIANIFARMGAEVYYVLDDGNLSHWDTRQIHQQEMPDNAGKTLHNKVVEFLLSISYFHKNIKKLKLSDFISKEEVNIEKLHLDDYDEDNCISSVRRFFECGRFDKDNSEHQKYYHRCRLNCAIMKVGIRNIVNQIVPDVAISSHGIYSIWGSAYNVLTKEKQIPTYIYGAHVYCSDATLFTNTLCQTLTKDSDAIEYMEKGEFTDENYKQIAQYFQNRRLHTTKDTSIYYSWMDNVAKDDYKKDVNEKHVPSYCLFTSIIWDGDVAQRDTIFKGMLDNTIYTINKFRSLPYNLYVRIHPAEATLWKDSVKMGDIIRHEIPDIDSIPNVYIIDSTQPIDSYQFVKDNIDVALVYDGILSLELTAIGFPVIAAAVTRYANGDYVICPKSVSEYDYYLENPNECKSYLTKEKIDKMHKFAYWFIFKAGYCLPIYDENSFGKLDFSSYSIKKMNTPDFSRFVNKLISCFE